MPSQQDNDEQNHYWVGLHTVIKFLQCIPGADVSIIEASKRPSWLSVHDNQLNNFSSPKPRIIRNRTDQNRGKIGALLIRGLRPVAYRFIRTGPYVVFSSKLIVTSD
jgi:hypothetical protein